MFSFLKYVFGLFITQFPQANMSQIIERLAALVAPHREELMKEAQSGCVSFEAFRDKLIQISGGQLHPHQIMTVAR